MYALRVEKLSKDFGALRVLHDVSLEVKENEIRIIIGPNGAGKTTLFNLICGNLRASGGRIFLFDEDVTFMPTYRRAQRGLGRTFQVTNLFFELSILDNVILAMQNKTVNPSCFWSLGKDSIDSANVLLNQFPSLDEKRDTKVKDLSYGEQRQMELVLGLALNSKILLLDEPMAGLSFEERSAMVSMIRRVSEKYTVVIIEHDMDVVFDLAERITVLHYGRVLLDGDKEELRNSKQVREIYLGATEGA